MSALRPLAVFGGTFNPVHYGHLRSSVELIEQLQLEELRLMPSAVPPHREAPHCSARHRAAMVSLAVEGEPQLFCDERELERAGKSYTIDSLMELRRELGAQRSLCMVIGCDALLGIESWHRWQELLEWAHVIVIGRPGWELPKEGVVAQWVSRHQLENSAALQAAPGGGVLLAQLRPLAISSTEIRELLAAGRSIRYLVPQSVLEYIETHKLFS